MHDLNHKAVLSMVMLACAVTAEADKVLTGEGTFYAESYHSMNDCKEGALQKARVNALATEYGRTVGEHTTSVEQTGARGEDSFFQALSTTEVRGEWIADEGEPKYDISLGNDGLYVVKCTVRGNTRPLSNEAVEFQALVLRNGNDASFADTNFKSGDSMRVLFKSPVDGYLAAYLACPDGNVYTLLPYLSSNGADVKVKGGKEYVLFSPVTRDLGEPDEMQLFTEDPVERNQLYVVFSPNPFSRITDSANEGNVPRSLNFKDFNKWISKCRSRDAKMGLVMAPLTIKN